NTGIFVRECLPICSDHQEPVCLDDGVGWECKIHAAADLPTAQVDICRRAIVHFDVLLQHVFRGGVIHDLIDDHLTGCGGGAESQDQAQCRGETTLTHN